MLSAEQLDRVLGLDPATEARRLRGVRRRYARARRRGVSRLEAASINAYSQEAYRRRGCQRLLRHLGGRCRFCGSRANLSLDTIRPSTPGTHPRSSQRALRYYRREYLFANLQPLCGHCNGVKGRTANYEPPFIPDPYA